jgi:hypothetical protein
MSSSQQTLDGTPADHLRRHLQLKRQDLIDSGTYLGQPDHDFLHDVTWERTGNNYQLMMKPSHDNINKKSTSKEPSDNSVNIIPTSQLANLSAVVLVSYNGCWLTLCGFWKEPNQIMKRFEDLKLSFHGEQPNHEVFAIDFSHVLKNL